MQPMVLRNVRLSGSANVFPTWRKVAFSAQTAALTASPQTSIQSSALPDPMAIISIACTAAWVSRPLAVGLCMSELILDGASKTVDTPSHPVALRKEI